MVKRSRKVVPVDRISDLPDLLICHILSFITTKCAVATSILGRRWRFLWTKVPSLHFDESEGEECFVFGEHFEIKTKTMSFLEFVNRVLLHHDAEYLQKFHLEWSDCDAVNLHMWTSYAIALNVRVLYLGISFYGKSRDFRLHLPRTLFTSTTLEFLHLWGPFLLKLPCLVHLPKLNYLSFTHVYYESPDSFQNLISSCPVLHSLSVVSLCRDCVPVYKISSPSLRCLEMQFYGDEFIRILELDLPLIQSLVLHGDAWNMVSIKGLTNARKVDLQHKVDGIWTMEVIEALKHVELLTLKGTIVKGLSCNVDTPLSSWFERLTTLVLEIECCHWSFLDDIICHSTKLRVLDLFKVGICGNETHSDCWKDPQQVPECLSSLTNVSFKGFKGLDDEMGVMKYILAHGVKLKSINLQSAADPPSDFMSKFRMFQRILMFPKLSADCSVEMA